MAWYGLVSYDMLRATYDQMKARTEFFAFPQQTTLAVRITADTPGAVPCPNFDEVREVDPIPDDPECLGVGWIIPPVAGRGIQRGFLNPVPFDCVLVPGEVREQVTEQGVTQYPDATVAYWPPEQGRVEPKKGDVFIVALPGDPRTYRYVVADVETPSVLGSQTLLYRASLEPRRRDNIVYSVPPYDKTGLLPGTWE